MKFHAKIMLSIALFSLLSNLSISATSEPIQDIINQRVENGYNVGVAVAVITAQGTNYYFAGKISKQPDAPAVTKTSVFPIASISKVFTALLLAQEVEDGKMHLNDPAQKYLSKDIHLPTFQEKEITLEQLATHTSGLPVKPGDIHDPKSYGNLTNDEVSNFINHYQLKYQPGEKYVYSDLGIGILGSTIAYTENMNFPLLVKQKILEPLGMTSTYFATQQMPQPNLAIGYGADEQAVNYVEWPEMLQGAGAMYSTVSDLALFVQANMGLLHTNFYPAIQLSHVPLHSEGPPKVNLDFYGIGNLYIGLGWNIDRHNGLIWKSGNIPGFTSFVGFDVNKKTGVVVLVNTDNIIYTDNLGMHILKPSIKLLPIYKEESISQLDNKYAGKYYASDHTYYDIKVEGNHLKVQHIYRDDSTSAFFNLYPLAINKFFGKMDDAVFYFKEKNQQITGFTLRENKYILKAKKQPKD